MNECQRNIPKNRIHIALDNVYEWATMNDRLLVQQKCLCKANYSVTGHVGSCTNLLEETMFILIIYIKRNRSIIFPLYLCKFTASEKKMGVSMHVAESKHYPATLTLCNASLCI